MALPATRSSPPETSAVDVGDEQFHVVVQNTFVNVVDISTSASRQSSLRAVRSDSFLCGLGAKVDSSRASGGNGSSLFQHQRGFSEASSTTAECAGAEEDDASSEDPRDASGEPSSSAQGPSAAADADAEHMAKENDRLARENAALLEEVRHLQGEQERRGANETPPMSVAASPSQGGFVCANGQASSFGSYNTMWMPVEFACVKQTWTPNTEYAEVHSGASGAQAGGQRAAGACWESSRTTVMLRNLPNNYTRAMLMSLMEREGFGSAYNFLYLPIDFRTQAALGYAFLNMAHPSVVERFWKVFDGYSRWSVPSRKLCIVSWCEPNQGLELHIERYRNCPVMHDSVPDEYKPVLLQDGFRVLFPPPTKAMRAPRVRDCRRDYR